MDQNTDQSQGQNEQQSTPKQSVVARVQQATNVLVTVKSNPSVDELAATIGLTLMLNKLGKHATAVFSGAVPSTLEFLQPEETLEANTDSLRDFIVSLDKSKADKLRYKVEENVVKIFITPYRTSITQNDLEFTQGDFNVDVVLALGVTQREELDQAITSHGRILHDATVITVTAGQDISELGQINWQEPAASSLSEMLVSISEAFQGGLIDTQIATAFLTGIVAETERFSNDKTSPKVMTMSAQLMAAGANQQLIANELGKAVEIAPVAPIIDQSAPTQSEDSIVKEDGTLSIQHDEPEVTDKPAEQEVEPLSLPEVVGDNLVETPSESQDAVQPLSPPSDNQFGRLLSTPEQPAEMESFNPLTTNDSPAAPETSPQPSESLLPLPPGLEQHEAEVDGQIHIDKDGNLMRRASAEPKHKVIQPLSREEEVPDVLPAEPIIPEQPPVLETYDVPAASTEQQAPTSVLPPAPEMDMTPAPPIMDDTTLTQIEEAVASPHLNISTPDADSARNAVADVFNQQPFDPAHNVRNDIGSLPLDTPPAPASYDSFRLPDTFTPVSTAIDAATGMPPAPEPPQNPALTFQLPTQPEPNFAMTSLGQPQDSGISPPPVPPPMMPQ